MITPHQADLFTVPLLDGGIALGQVADVLPDGMLRLLLTLSRDGTPRPIGSGDVIATLYTAAAPLADGFWQITGYDALPPIAPVTALPEDAEIHDPAVIEAFLNACHCLYPWDGFPDPEAFARMLDPGVAPPPGRRLARDLA